VSGWWVCGMCETANTPTAVICEVCEGGRGAVTSRGLKGDLVERVTSRPGPALDRSASAGMRAAAPSGAGVMPPSRATWQQRLRAGADRFYKECAGIIKECADIIRSVMRALS